MEEPDSDKRFYELEQEYDNVPQRPVRNIQIHDTLPARQKTPFVLLGVQAFVILILIILLGINGVTLSHLNTVDMCDSTGASTGASNGASTDGVAAGDTSTAQILNMTQELLNQRDNDTKVIQNLFQVLANNMTQVLQQLMYTQGNTELLNMHTNILQGLDKNISQVSQQLGSTEAKVDDMRSVVDDHLVHTLNVSDVLNQVQQTTGESAQRLVNIVNTLSNLQDTTTSAAGVTDDILVIAEELLQLQNLSSLFNSITPVSCKDVKAVLPSSPSGWYNLNNQNTYCNMDELCGLGGGWTRLAYLDMSDATQNCPSGFRLYQSGGVRACGRTNSSGGSCASVQFPSNGISYSQICGRVTGYQDDSTDAFLGPSDINSYYVDGVSITRGSPRQHVWTLASGITGTSNNNPNSICPCSNGSTQTVPSFVGSHYFCESGNNASSWSSVLYTSDPLWDGQGCGVLEATCCAASGLPWFHRDYGSTTTTDYIELRVCGSEGFTNEDTPVSFYELYVE